MTHHPHIPTPPTSRSTLMPFVRTLGIYIGSDDQIEQTWKSHTTHKMKTRFDLWRRRFLPSTFEGKNTVNKTVSLPVSGSLLSTNHPPSSTPYYPAGKKTPGSSTMRPAPAAPLRLTRSIPHPRPQQRRHTRGTDANTFARALYASQVHALHTPL